MTPKEHLELDCKIAILTGWAGPLDECPRYSSSLESAWLLVAKIQADGYRLAVNTTCDAGYYDIVIGTAWHDMEVFTFHPLPLGICKAFMFYKDHKANNQKDNA